MKLIEVLKGFDLQKNDIEAFEGIFTQRIQLSTGEMFLKEGQTVKGMGFIVKGACRYYYNKNGNEYTRWVSLEGDFITSLGSFFHLNPSCENIQAIQDTEIIFASKSNWDLLLKKNESLRGIWQKQIEDLYVWMEQRVFHLIALNAEERYQWMFENQPHFIAQVPDKYLAQMLGITPRHISRLRSKRI